MQSCELVSKKQDKMKDFWDARYAQADFAYGTEPNEFLRTQLPKLKLGTGLFAAEGEGRNAVYAAQLGWEVHAFDLSVEGKAKADRWAAERGVEIDYQVGEFAELGYANEAFDLLALIYAHFPGHLKADYHRRLSTFVKVGGYVIFEAFSKNHLAYNSVNEAVGGPKDTQMLFSMEEIKADFADYELLELYEAEVELAEGTFHRGRGSVIRFVGRKL